MPTLPILSRHRQDQRVNPGIERSTTKGHTQINTRRFPESKHFIDRPNTLRPRLTICRLRNVFDPQLDKLIKNPPRVSLYMRLPADDQVRLRTRKTHPLRRTKQPLHPPNMNHIRQANRMLHRIPQFAIVHDATPRRVFIPTRPTPGTSVADSITECTPSSNRGS